MKLPAWYAALREARAHVALLRMGKRRPAKALLPQRKASTAADTRSTQRVAAHLQETVRGRSDASCGHGSCLSREGLHSLASDAFRPSDKAKKQGLRIDVTRFLWLVALDSNQGPTD